MREDQDWNPDGVWEEWPWNQSPEAIHGVMTQDFAMNLLGLVKGEKVIGDQEWILIWNVGVKLQWMGGTKGAPIDKDGKVAAIETPPATQRKRVQNNNKDRQSCCRLMKKKE